MRTKSRKLNSGFTLVELLVVIAIIAVLLAVLMPALSKVRWMAKVNTCRSNFKALGMACLIYAGDFNGSYPSYKLTGTVGANTWDVHYKFVDDMRNKYNIGLKMFYCPAAQGEGHTRPYPGSDKDAYVDIYYSVLTTAARANPTQSASDIDPMKIAPNGNSMIEIRQSLWIPRQMSDGRWFPAPGGVPSPELPKKYCAPLKDNDPTRSIYPIMSDVCYTSGQNLVGLSSSDYVNTINNGGHKRNDVVESVNSLYGDGRVETNKTNQLAPRYYGNFGTHWW